MKYILVIVISLCLLSCGGKNDDSHVIPMGGTLISSKIVDADSSSKEKWTLDSIAAYLSVMGKCRKLEDSEKGLYIQYAQGSATYEEYKSAKKVYDKYFFETYKPFYDRLCNQNNKK